MEKRFKKVCKCENCGNEAEMAITCQLEPEAVEAKAPVKAVPIGMEGKTQGRAVCSHCGNEADLWVDL
jgi:hypothetical protein